MNSSILHSHGLAAFGLLVALSGCRGSGVDDSVDGGAGDSSTGASSDPIGARWEWVATVTPVERIEARDPSRYSIVLAQDGSVDAQFDCNRGSGSYEITENRIEFGVFAATRMACPEDTQDIVFMSQLEEVTTFFMRDNELFLEMPVDSGTMRFRNAAPP